MLSISIHHPIPRHMQCQPPIGHRSPCSVSGSPRRSRQCHAAVANAIPMIPIPICHLTFLHHPKPHAHTHPAHGPSICRQFDWSRSIAATLQNCLSRFLSAGMQSNLHNSRVSFHVRRWRIPIVSTSSPMTCEVIQSRSTLPRHCGLRRTLHHLLCWDSACWPRDMCIYDYAQRDLEIYNCFFFVRFMLIRSETCRSGSFTWLI